ncbi:cyclin-dependent kinase 2-associated protein 1-like [Wyeomyia smithii]|uniref:cyclin-dependent kinase 2-associated protein 1-like n=1 Tax=Wyeomyia smithii TaxID=174621 RepID=UPI002467C7A6|nr:cyclin-dependent kinase 2-associated protein 1-like [Wyeomyia smithii]
MNYLDIQTVESKLVDVTVTPVLLGVRKSPGLSNVVLGNQQQQFQSQYQFSTPAALGTVPVIATSKSTCESNSNFSKYSELLMVLEEMGSDIRPTYSGSRNSTERLKRGIVHARILVRECLLEAEKSARQ